MTLAILLAVVAGLLALSGRVPWIGLAMMAGGGVTAILGDGMVSLAGFGGALGGAVWMAADHRRAVATWAGLAALLGAAGVGLGDALTVAGAAVLMGVAPMHVVMMPVSATESGKAVRTLGRILGVAMLLTVTFELRPSWWPVLLALGAAGLIWGGRGALDRSAKWMDGAALASTSLCALCLGIGAIEAATWLLIAVSLAEAGAVLAETAGSKRAVGLAAALTFGGLLPLGWRGWAEGLTAIADAGLWILGLIGALSWLILAWRSVTQIATIQAGLTLNTPPRRLQVAMGVALILLVGLGLLPVEMLP
ncbi:MAG: hypothetical protein AAFV53_14045 [Myxococcota bacterium]